MLTSGASSSPAVMVSFCGCFEGHIYNPARPLKIEIWERRNNIEKKLGKIEWEMEGTKSLAKAFPIE